MGKHELNFKSLLQQYAQRELGGTPTYSVIREEGPDHVKQFHVIAVVNGTEYASASGRSKKEAEQRAAELTLRSLIGAAGLPREKPGDGRDETGKEEREGGAVGGGEA
jgi:dsRNA-specific ribonuclease